MAELFGGLRDDPVDELLAGRQVVEHADHLNRRQHTGVDIARRWDAADVGPAIRGLLEEAQDPRPVYGT